jgi:hypothetical protein
MGWLACQDQVYDSGETGVVPVEAETGKTGVRVVAYARADIQGISGVKDCDQEHRRPEDPRTGRPVPIWGLECAAHEAWIFGDDRPKILIWVKEGSGFRQQRVNPVQDGWSRTIDGIPLTPDQARAEDRRNSLTRRAEQAALQQGIASMAAAYDHQPVTRELLRARQFAGKQTAACHSCYAEFVAGAAFCPDCGVRVAGVPAPAAIAGPAEIVEA